MGDGSVVYSVSVPRDMRGSHDDELGAVAHSPGQTASSRAVVVSNSPLVTRIGSHKSPTGDLSPRVSSPRPGLTRRGSSSAGSIGGHSPRAQSSVNPASSPVLPGTTKSWTNGIDKP